MKRGIIVVLLFITVIVCRYYTISMNMPTHFFIACDEIFSLNSKTLFYDQLQLCAQKKRSISDAASYMKKHFSYIKNISISYYPSKSIVSVTAHKPLCLINDIFILLDNGTVSEKSFFCEYVVKKLPAISVTQEILNDSLPIIAQLCDKCSPSFYETYNVHMQDQDTLVLKDIHTPLFTIIASISQQNFETMLCFCEQVKKIVMTPEECGKNISWIADTRFAHYIIAHRA